MPLHFTILYIITFIFTQSQGILLLLPIYHPLSPFSHTSDFLVHVTFYAEGDFVYQILLYYFAINSRKDGQVTAQLFWRSLTMSLNSSSLDS